ncbi:hypothetical protein KIPB_010103, partial [Kipferlia bialata]|eukprot:g10103.t1
MVEPAAVKLPPGYDPACGLDPSLWSMTFGTMDDLLLEMERQSGRGWKTT